MPADLRARLVPPPERRGLTADEFARNMLRSYMVVRPPSRVQLVWRGVAAVGTLVFAVVFAGAGVMLARSTDPFVAVAPFGVAALMGWCAYEISPARASRSIWIMPVRGPSAGVGLVETHAESAPAWGKAPAAIDL